MSTMTHVGSTVFDRFLTFLDAKGNTKTMLRLLYLEARRNLALLDAIGTKKPVSPKTYRAIVDALEFVVLESMFMATQNEKAALSALKGLKPTNTSEDASSVPVQAFLMNLYVRVAALQKIAVVDDAVSAKGLKQLNYAKRLANLKADYKKMVKQLEPAAKGKK